MHCPSCNHDNSAERRFCGECGAALVAMCAACGASNGPREKFCGSCGARLPVAPATPSIAVSASVPELDAALPAGERRQLTVLFCDLVGSTPLSQQLDAEEWRDVISRYQRAATEAVEKFGGHVAKNLGDGLLIYFGWPTAREDDPQRAVRAGLAIVDAMRAVKNPPVSPFFKGGAEGVPPFEKGGLGGISSDASTLHVRVGLHTGPVVIADGGEVFGETVNVAARVQSAAEPDTVLITAATHRLIAGLFTVEEREPQPLKGVDRPVTLYRVLQPSGVRGRLAAAAPHGLTPFVGRAHERELLRQLWAQARGGEGHVALVTGEAGIGKSRLVQTLKEDLAAEPHTWIECNGSPYHQNTPFFAVTDMLQQVLAWRGDEDGDERLAALEQALTRAGLPLNDALPLMAPLLSLPVPERYPKLFLSPEAQRRETLRTLAAWLFASARLQPVVTVLEDLHWVDPSTLELQTRLVEQGTSVPLLLIYTARPEFRVPWPLLGHHTQLTLSRLGTAEVRAMIESVASHTALSEDVMQTVVKRTDGVPLFVEELTKTVLGAPDSRAIPVTLEDSLRARLDRLGSAKDVAQIGAVIGREFSYALVRAVAGTGAGGRASEADLHAALGKLTDGDLLYVRGVPPAATYIFKHALVQDSAYASLLKSRRRALHAAIAAALTEQFPDVVEAQPELMAHHYAEAGDIAQAVTHYQRAGERAMRRSANEEAIIHLRRALALVGTLPETRERHRRELGLQMAIGAPLGVARGWAHPEYERTYARARELASQIGEAPELPRVLVGVAMAYIAKGDVATAAEVAQEALATAERTGEAFDLLAAHYRVGLPLLLRGHFSRALQHFEQSIELYNPSEHGSLAYSGDFRLWRRRPFVRVLVSLVPWPSRPGVSCERGSGGTGEARGTSAQSGARSLACCTCPSSARRARPDSGTRQRTCESRRAARVSDVPGTGKVLSRLCAGRIRRGRGGYRGDAAGAGRTGSDR